MYVIDINTSFGKRVDPDPRFAPAALVEELARHRVARAFTYSERGVHYSALHGNTETLAVAKQHSALLPVAVLNPRESIGWQAEIDRCLRGGVRAFRFFPAAQVWTASGVMLRDIFQYLSGTGAAVIFSGSDSPTSWDLAGPLAEMTAKLKLPLILVDTRYWNQSEVAAVMRKYRHVYTDTRWLATVGGVDVMAEAVGADRLLYSSAAPSQPMQKALNEVLEADLSDKDKIAILGGNARRLFRIALKQLAGAPQLESLEPARFDEEIIDVHSHLGYWPFPIPVEDYDPVPMIRRMRRFGITRSVLSSYESMRYDLAAGNRAVAKAIDGHPELRGYVEVDPHHLELTCAEMDRYYRLPNFAGCEVELTHIPCPTASPKVRALCAEIAKRGKPVLFKPHAAGDAAAERALAREFPDLVLIHAHGFDREWAMAVRDTPNISVEYCASFPSHLDVRDGLDVLGPERVLFGSDQTLLSVGAAVGLYLDAKMTPAERKLVLSGNARRLFKL